MRAHFLAMLQDGVRLTEATHVFFVVLAAALASAALASLPVLFMIRFERTWLGRMVALAVGLIGGSVVANSRQAFEVSLALRVFVYLIYFVRWQIARSNTRHSWHSFWCAGYRCSLALSGALIFRRRRRA